MRLTALKSKEVDETEKWHKQKGRAQTRTSTDRGAEPSFLAGRASLLSQADQDHNTLSGRALFPGQTGTGALSQNGMSHCMGPVSGQCGWDGGLRRALLAGADRSFPGRRAERAFSQSVVTNPCAQGRPVTGQTWTSTDRGAEPSFPDRQTALSQADQDQRLKVESHNTRGVRTP